MPRKITSKEQTLMPFPPLRSRLACAVALVLPMALALAGCGGVPRNASLYSPHQPVVTHASYTLDLAVGPDGLPVPEQERLAGWFTAMQLRYGDQIAIADPLSTRATRASVGAVVERFGLLLADEPAPGADAIAPGSVRVIITRAQASVPHCPDWSGNSAANPASATSTNFGCAVNSNLAAMVANPDQLLKGATTSGHTGAMTVDKAISSWRAAPPATSDTAKETSTRQ
jgi:pilus assembly protein CpaD